jgi:hypothetical protein
MRTLDFKGSLRVGAPAPARRWLRIRFKCPGVTE